MNNFRMRSYMQILGLAIFLLPFIHPDARAWKKDGLRLRGRLQVRWNIEKEVILEPGPLGQDQEYVYVKTGDWVDYFNVRRGRFDARWEPEDWIRLMIEFDLADRLDPKDVYARLKLHPLLRIQAGQFKKPFSRLKMTSPYDLVIPERGMLDRFVVRDTYYGGYGGRDIGLMLSGVWDGPVKLRYYLGAFNNPLSDDFYHRDYVARLQVRLFKGLVLAVDASHKLYDGEIRDAAGCQIGMLRRTGNLFGADLRWTLGDFRLQLEGAFGDNVGPDPDNPPAVRNGWGNSLYGLHGIVSYQLKISDWLTLEPAFMAEVFDPNAEDVSQAVRLAGALNADMGRWIRVVLYGEGLLDNSAEYDTPTTFLVQLELRL